MKLLMCFLLSLSVYAAPTVTLETECYKIVDNIDREYCQKKKLSILRGNFAKEEGTWKDGLSSSAKAQKTKSVNEQVLQAKELISVYQNKLTLLEAHKEKLAKVKIKTAKKKKKKKKKKKRSDLEKALNIKL